MAAPAGFFLKSSSNTLTPSTTLKVLVGGACMMSRASRLVLIEKGFEISAKACDGGYTHLNACMLMRTARDRKTKVSVQVQSEHGKTHTADATRCKAERDGPLRTLAAMWTGRNSAMESCTASSDMLAASFLAASAPALDRGSMRAITSAPAAMRTRTALTAESAAACTHNTRH